MIRTRISKLLVVAAVAAAGLIGVGIVATPITPVSHAAPCTDWVFPGPVTLTKPGPPVTFASGTKFMPASATQKIPGVPDITLPAQGGINGLDINFSVGNDNFNGTIDTNSGIASGKVNGGADGWAISPALKCATPAPVNTKCPDGSVKAEVTPPDVCAPPVNAVTMKISKNGLTNARVEITNNGNLGGTCAYDASSDSGLLPSVSRTVDLAPKGKATITDLLWPPLGSTYHVVLSCNGTYDGKQVEFGHVEQNVSSF